MTIKKNIRSFRDLNVYKESYNSMLSIHSKIIPKLPKMEDFDLKSQLRRSTKAIPRLIAEGHSKRHQKRGFQKYIDDALAGSNETLVSLSQVIDIYAEAVDIKLCEELIDKQDKISRQLYKLALSWDNFNKCNRKTISDSSYVTDQRTTECEDK